MKFIVNKTDIFKTLSHLQGIVSKKNTLPILSNILIEAENNTLTLSSTDMDISIKETIACNIILPVPGSKYAWAEEVNKKKYRKNSVLLIILAFFYFKDLKFTRK